VDLVAAMVISVMRQISRPARPGAAARLPSPRGGVPGLRAASNVPWWRQRQRQQQCNSSSSNMTSPVAIATTCGGVDGSYWAACGMSTQAGGGGPPHPGPGTSRAARRRRAKAAAKQQQAGWAPGGTGPARGHPHPNSFSPAAPQQRDAEEKFGRADIRRRGGLLATLRAQATAKGPAFVGYWAGTWAAMYGVIWAGMETVGVDAVAMLHALGADVYIHQYLGLDVGTVTPSLVNGLVAIEVNFMLEFVRLPCVFWILRKRAAT
jgi:hypothetical protein